MSGQPKNLQRNNHYLPACYQEAFTGPDGRVWAKFAGKEPEPRKPASLGRSRSFYIRNINGVEDDRVESFFGREVEDRFAGFARRIKIEGNALASIEPQEQAGLLLFIASQAVRTLAHKRCIDTQAGREVARDEFLRAMNKQMWTVADIWGKNPPTLRFFTNLPFVSDQFIILAAASGLHCLPTSVSAFSLETALRHTCRPRRWSRRRFECSTTWSRTSPRFLLWLEIGLR
jgi:hypothetical protein